MADGVIAIAVVVGVLAIAYLWLYMSTQRDRIKMYEFSEQMRKDFNERFDELMTVESVEIVGARAKMVAIHNALSEDQIASFDGFASIAVEPICEVLRRIDHKDCALALIDASPAVRMAIYKGMSQRAQTLMGEESDGLKAKIKS